MAPSTGVPPRLVLVEDVVDAAMLRDAIRSRLKLRLIYRAQNGEEAERSIWPACSATWMPVAS
jgi:predicted DNA-binding transcriptional regulator YafY